jgi:hypothetical protein
MQPQENRMTADHYRRQLTDKQKAALKRFEKKASLTPYEQGQLAAFRMFGDDDEKKRAKTILDLIEKGKTRA